MARHDLDASEAVDLAILRGVARPCPDCAEERLFVPADPDDGGCYCCTWCGAALLIDPVLSMTTVAPTQRRGVA